MIRTLLLFALAFAGSARADTVVVPVRVLEPGQVVRAHDLRVVEVRNPRRVAYAIARTPSDAVGREVKRRLRPRRYVPLAALRAPLAIRRGERIELRYRHGGVTIAARARALDDAGAGESLRVRLRSGRRAVEARAVEAGVAEVVR